LFVHIAKDYMKKLDDLESRLAVSMDRDEINTLGLKLRFYHNEIKNYTQRMRQIHDRIIEIQRKYGFKPEEQDLPLSAPAPKAESAAPPPPQDNAQDAIKLLADWVMQLQKQGHSPQEALAKARDYIRQGRKSGGINITLPEESAATLVETEPEPPAPEDIAPEPEPEPEIPGEPEPAQEPDGETPAALDGGESGEPPAAESGAPISLQEAIESVQRHAARRDSEGDAEPQQDASLEDPAANAEIQEPEPAPAPETPERDLPLDALLARWERESTRECPPPDLTARLDALVDARRAEIIAALEALALSLKENNGLDGRSGFLLLCLGYFAHRLGREGLAITTIERSLNLGCAYPVSFLVLGRCFQEKRIHEKALINFKFANRLDADLPAARLGIARSLLALNRHEEALDYLADQSFENEDDQIESILMQSQALEKLDRLPVAVDLLEQTVQNCRSTTGTAACLFRLGTIRETQKDLLKAIDLFEETVESDPDHLEARYTLGRLYMAHKAVPLARKHLYYLTRNHPDSKWADRARELV